MMMARCRTKQNNKTHEKNLDRVFELRVGHCSRPHSLAFVMLIVARLFQGLCRAYPSELPSNSSQIEAIGGVLAQGTVASQSEVLWIRFSEDDSMMALCHNSRGLPMFKSSSRPDMDSRIDAMTMAIQDAPHCFGEFTDIKRHSKAHREAGSKHPDE